MSDQPITAVTDAADQIRNYCVLGPAIGTGGQPSEAQLRALVVAGHTTFINLGLLDPKYCLPDEAGLLRTLGVSYHHLPVDFAAPTFDNTIAAMERSGRISSNSSSGPPLVETMSRKAATCGRSTSFAISLPAVE